MIDKRNILLDKNYDYFACPTKFRSAERRRGARYYDSEIGRWLSVDPLGEIQQGWTPYHYSYNNPIVFTDPRGMTPKFNSRDELYNYLNGNHDGENGNNGNSNKEGSYDDALQNGDGKKKNKSKIANEKNPQMSEFSRGIIKGDFTIDERLGQAVEISFKNLNILNVVFDITQEFPTLNNKSTKIVLFPKQTRTLKYFIFGSVPISWRFNISVFSDAA